MAYSSGSRPCCSESKEGSIFTKHSLRMKLCFNVNRLRLVPEHKGQVYYVGGKDEHEEVSGHGLTLQGSSPRAERETVTSVSTGVRQ